MKSSKILSLALLHILMVGSVIAQLPVDLQNDWQKMHQNKQVALEEFNQAKFGMFIHWGLYSELAGEWKGQKIPGLSEWIQYHAMIPKAEYGKLAKNFNPLKFDAEQWVLTAKKAGMKYIVITSKHHDGFSMYDTKFSDFSIAKATPFKRDPIDELYNACKKHGIRFGVYYSQIIDWWDGWDGGMYRADRKMTDMDKANPMNTWEPNKVTREEYLQNKAYPQVKELITKYPDMLEVWFDYWYEGSGDKYCTPQISYDFYKTLHSVSPKCLVSSRIGSGLGDFAAAGDNEIPTESKMAYWETPGTVNNTWGYNKFDKDWKSASEIIFWLADIASKGGNYLLNIGTKADGTIPQQSIDLLLEVGEWMKINGEAIYGTKKWKITREGPSSVEMKGTDERELSGFKAEFTNKDFWFTQKGQNVYAISLTKPNKELMIKSLNVGAGKITNVEILGKGKVKFEQNKDGLKVVIPGNFAPPRGFVIKVELN
jgi:alpha-L-fucosidase